MSSLQVQFGKHHWKVAGQCGPWMTCSLSTARPSWSEKEMDGKGQGKGREGRWEG